MASGRIVLLLTAGALALAACGTDAGVTADRADQIALDPTISSTIPGSAPTTTAPDTTTPGSETPPTSVPKATTSVPADPAAIDFGSDKPAKAYDDFLLGVMTDLQAWWSEQYPAIYGEPFKPLEGKVYAAYPTRPDDIPGCGAPTTTYQDVQDYVAFYCGVGDFMVYDDSDNGLLAQLAREYGSATIGTVFAHEFGHAIQLRNGTIDRNLPTIVTEQQADCFAGAWTGRVSRGESPTVRYSDGDVRAGLIAMTKVSDPVGIDQFTEGGHGSAFDRVGAFQVGFDEGPARCAELTDKPLPLVSNAFTSIEDQSTGGNAPFGYGAGDLLGFLPDDLNRYWTQEVSSQIPGMKALTLVAADSTTCADLQGDLTHGVALCPSTGEVLVNERAARSLYSDLGDFSVAYLLGQAWSEAVQEALVSPLRGEARVLVNDCLTGGWVKTSIPVVTAGSLGLPQPRAEGRISSVSAGDLDEAIQTVLTVADLGENDNVVGDAFEKIAALRNGVINGTDACLSQL